MKGLQAFITDLRNAKAREVEEKRVNTELAKIRGRFKEAKLSGYDRKKYVAKLLYMYILGWDVRFGHLEAVNLISSTKYSEKQIGYLACSLFFHEHHELMHLVVNSMRKDLLDDNELNTSLALHCIANIGGSVIGSALASDVHRLLIAATSMPSVRKKAALTLLRLYRRDTTIFQTLSMDRIVAHLDDEDIGVAQSVASLLEELLERHPQAGRDIAGRAALRLRRLTIESHVDSDDVYYKVPAPWLQLKLMRLVRKIGHIDDPTTLQLLEEMTDHVMDVMSARSSRNVQQSNIQNAILLEAIDLMVHLNLRGASDALQMLGKMLDSKETNLRYLSLSTMWTVAARPELRKELKLSTTNVMHGLRDRDLSVRRQALDLVYTLCDQDNAKTVIGELVRHLRSTDFDLRGEMVLKIAILVEKFTREYEWYLDVTLQLLLRAGEQVPDEVWQRIIQVVANNEALQEHAVRSVLRCLKEPCAENLVKVAAYVLGEYGHFVADSHESLAPRQQLGALQSKFKAATPATQAMLLSTYIKFYNLFPEVRDDILAVFENNLTSLYPEIQQRAHEYLMLATTADDSLLQAMCEEMPPFAQKISPLMSRLNAKDVSRTMRIDLSRMPNANDSTTTTPMLEKQFSQLGVLENTTSESRSPTIRSAPATPKALLSAGWESGYNRLLLRNKGVLYSDALIQVNMSWTPQDGRLSLFIVNQTSTPLESLKLDVQPQSNALSSHRGRLVSSSLAGGGTGEMVLDMSCHAPIAAPPNFGITFVAGSLQSYTLKLPIVLSKFLCSSETVEGADGFFQLWNGLADVPTDTRQSQQILDVKHIGRRLDRDRMDGVVRSYGWTTLAGVDPNMTNIVAVAELRTHRGHLPALLRLEPNLLTAQARLTIRCERGDYAVQLAADLAAGPLMDGL